LEDYLIASSTLWECRRNFLVSRYNRAMPPIHPEGEDTQADPVGTLTCPNCSKRISFPELANVDVFVCPECGHKIRTPREVELRP
jgi:DNA-directed RNA polymerase subunit RPC12/RpoP